MLVGLIGAKLPNYQGMFLRGQGSQAHSKNNGSTIGKTKTTHTSGALGVVQGDAIRNITGGFYEAYWNESSANFSYTGAFDGEYANSQSDASGNNVAVFNTKLDASRVIPTAIENRPVNVAVNYIIKAY